MNPSHWDQARLTHARYGESSSFSSGWLTVGALSVFLVAGMFYVMRSGTPQPADFFFAIVAVFLAGPAMRLHIAHGNYAVAALLVWVVAVNWTWYIISGDGVFIRFASFYIFNVLVFLIFAYAYEKYGDLVRRWFRLSIMVALLMQLGILLAGEDVFRAVGSFNNPNQLGYWCVLLLATYGIISHGRKVSWIDFLVVALALWICTMTLSRASIVPTVILSLTFLFFHPAKTGVRPAFLWGLAAVLVIVSLQGGVTHYISKIQSLEGVEERYGKALKSQRSELEVRGYDRIWRFPEYIFVGAGEGAFTRFYLDEDFELHSSFGTMLFSYGIVGLVLMLFVLYQSLRSTPLLVKAYFAPVLMYGVTHQSLRFSYFWVLLGIIAAIGSLCRAERRKLTRS